MNRSRSGASSTTSESRSYAATQATLSTYDKTAYTADKTEYTDETGSENNNNAAFLDQLANKPSVASQPARPSQKSLSDKLGKQTLAPYTGGSQGSNEVGWPTDNVGSSPAKDTIETHSSSYKKETARQAELIAAAKVEDMMKGLDHVDPDSESEI